jgi:hypothetical protein
VVFAHPIFAEYVPVAGFVSSRQGRFFGSWILWKTAKVTNSPLTETIDNFKRGGLPQTPQAPLLKTQIYPNYFANNSRNVALAIFALRMFAPALSVTRSLQGHFCVVQKSRRAHLYNYCVIVHTDKLYRIVYSEYICAEGARR